MEYIVNWTDRVDRSIRIEASSEKEAIKKVAEGDFNMNKSQEENVEFITEPWIDGYENE